MEKSEREAVGGTGTKERGWGLVDRKQQRRGDGGGR